MDEHQCTNCGASLPKTGTYCLACDTPVEGAVRGLSVGDTQVVENGRPLIAVAIVLAVVVVGVGIFLAAHSMVSGHANRSVAAAAEKGADIVVRAEAGHAGACPYVSEVFAGDPKAVKAQCMALVGDDPGAHFKHLHSSVQRSGSKGTVKLTGTLVDKTGKRPFSKTITLDKQGGNWMIAWDGSSYAKS